MIISVPHSFAVTCMLHILVLPVITLHTQCFGPGCELLHQDICSTSNISRLFTVQLLQRSKQGADSAAAPGPQFQRGPLRDQCDWTCIFVIYLDVWIEFLVVLIVAERSPHCCQEALVFCSKRHQRGTAGCLYCHRLHPVSTPLKGPLTLRATLAASVFTTCQLLSISLTVFHNSKKKVKKKSPDESISLKKWALTLHFKPRPDSKSTQQKLNMFCLQYISRANHIIRNVLCTYII